LGNGGAACDRRLFISAIKPALRGGGGALARWRVHAYGPSALSCTNKNQNAALNGAAFWFTIPYRQ